jgi:uncharacterized repeat protein (TIGR01451 family)
MTGYTQNPDGSVLVRDYGVHQGRLLGRAMRGVGQRLCRRRAWGVLVAAIFGVAANVHAANPVNGLRIDPITGYNLVIDSNGKENPEAAYLAARFCNDGTGVMNNVIAYIGNYSGSTNTPGVYPVTFQSPFVGPLPGGGLALTHEGGSFGSDDAKRNLGSLAPGECRTVYWLISYESRDENGLLLWGNSVKPDDDLVLNYDFWATAEVGSSVVTAEQTRTVTFRNEISAMANKIYPNNASKVPNEYLELLAKYAPEWTNFAADGSPGTPITTEGIWYDLGNVGHGFDNDGDLVPDKNAWMQPIGNVALFDPSCFRLVRTYAMVVVKLVGGGEQVYLVEDQLYFENIPENNGAVGLVGYQFMSLRGGCVAQLTPYQEVASGFDNEKFNADYGATVGRLSTPTSSVFVAKGVDPPIVTAGTTLTYTITYTNAGGLTIGDVSYGTPIVIHDKIPTGTYYIGGSATASNVLPAGVTNYTVYYSTNNGLTYTTNEPPSTNVTDIQWVLSDPLDPGSAGEVEIQVVVQNPFPSDYPLIVNTGCLTIAGMDPFECDTSTAQLRGTNRLGDTVFADTGVGGGFFGNQVQDGAEPGLSGVVVSVYYDLNSNGLFDVTDLFMGSETTDASGYYLFTNLVDGLFVAVVDQGSPNIPTGYTLTTLPQIPADLDSPRTNGAMVQYLLADFGFAPVLSLDKERVGTNTLYEGQTITYTITVTNRMPGDGTGAGGPAIFTTWGTNGETLTPPRAWTTPQNAWSPPGPDGIYAMSPFDNAGETIIVSNFTLGAQLGTITNVQIRIPYVLAFGTFGNADMDITVSRKSPATVLWTTNFLMNSLTNGTIVTTNGIMEFNVTGTHTWEFTSFDTNYAIEILTTKQGNNPGELWVDSVGFKIWSSQTNTGTNVYTTLDPVPLTDNYDTNKIRYVSSSITPTYATNAAATGILYWANLGPIYAGGAVTITSRFTALEPPNNVTSAFTNVAFVTNATFMSGTPANKATDLVVTAVSPAGTIGDYIWRDLNANGVQETNELGISFVSVVLTPPADVDLGNGLGAAITNQTDASGYYYFYSLPATATYTVRVLTATLPGGTGTNTYDEDGVRDNRTAVYIDVNTSGTNNTHLTTDYGYQVGTTIEGTIWHDLNRNGTNTPDSGEQWLQGITVYLCSNASPCGAGSAMATNVTDSNGYFRFVGNYTGTLSVSVNTNTGPLSSGNWTQSFDTDGTTSSNHVTVTVTTGSVARADYSYYLRGNFSVGDTLWYDWNGNGTQQTNEEGMAYITVSLYEDANSNGMVDVGIDALIGVQSTSATGTYLFTGLPASNYLVIVDQADPQFPPYYTTTWDPQGAYDGRSTFNVTASNRLDQDFGYRPYGCATIGDTVWKDMNFDGVQLGPLETGISNVTVRLFIDANGDGSYVLFAATNTSALGKYQFTGLPISTYRIALDTGDPDLPSGYATTTATNYSFTVSGCETNLTYDFGYGQLGSIGDTIFWDANENGTQDWTEPGVTNARVNLYIDVNGDGFYDGGDTLYATTLTDSNGVYTFADLTTGRYVVVVVETGVLFGVSLMADPDADGFPCSSTNAVGCDGQDGVNLGAGQNYVGADFGYVPRGILGDTVWIDTDNDGVRGANELGIPDITIYLYTNGVPIATNTTDADGYYIFVNLPDGRYRVQVATNDPDFPSGLVQSYDPDGMLNHQGTNIIMSNGMVVAIGTNACTDCDLHVDFGYRYSGTNSLSGTVGLDYPTYDGVMGTGTTGVASNEVPFPGVTMYLYRWIDTNNNGIVQAGEYVMIASTLTETNGDYSFTGLPSGSGTNSFYVVSMAAPDDYLKLTTTNGSAIPATKIVETTNYAGNTISVYEAVPIAPVITNMDFAFKYTLNFDFGDLPVSYKTQLQDIPSGARHIVNAQTNLYLGSFVDTEANGQPSTNAMGDDDVGTFDDEDGVIPLNAWHAATNNAGGIQFIVGAGTGWLVGYVDFTRDGDFTDPGEMILNLAVSNTGGNGSGVYSNTFAIPTNALIDATNLTPFFARFRLFPSAPPYPEIAYQGVAQNGEVEDYLFRLGAIGDLIWNDQDGDGIKDASEPPLPGVIVYLDLNNDGLRQAYEPYGTTDTNGIYGIGGLNSGTYVARVDTTTLPDGLSPSYDLDGTSTIHSATFSVSNSQIRLDVDFGYYGSGVVGDYVWDDYDGDGIQDPNEPGLSNVTVGIYNLQTNLLGQSITDANGQYIIRALTPSNYYVVFDLLPGYEWSSPDQGTDDARDSDANTNTGASVSFLLPLNTTNLTLDGGMHRPATDLAVTKGVNNTNPNILETIFYTVSITNNGPYDASLVTVTDAFPVVSLSYVSNTPSQGTYNPTTYVWSVGSLPVGSNATILFYATVRTNTGATMITNTAWLAGMNRPDYVPTNNTGTVVILVQSADIGVGKIVSTNNPAESNLVAYTVYVTNAGPNNASNIVVNDLLPAGLTYSNASPSQGTYNSTNGNWSVGALTVGSSASLVITARVNGGTAGNVLTNCATVTASSHADQTPANNTACAELTVQSVDLAVTKRADPTAVNEGGQVVYTVLVSNRGPVTAQSVMLYDVVTNNQSYVSHGTSQGTYNGTNGSWSVGTLAVDAVASLTITATVASGTAGGAVTNIAWLTNSVPRDVITTNNTGAVVVSISDLRISKVSNVSTTDPGSNITYTVTVTNSGAVTHTNLNLVDPVPTGTTFVAGSATSRWQTIFTNNVREEWNNVAYNNNDGSSNWLGNWTETGDNADPASGEVMVMEALGRTNLLRIENSSRGVRRSVNLSGYSNAILSFEWSTYALDAGEWASISIATNGTVSPVQLMVVTGNFTSLSYTQFNIAPYIGTNTTLIITNNNLVDNNEGSYFDNIDIAFSRTITNTQTGASMPNLATNISLQASYAVTLTFQVTVDSFLSITQIVNTVAATSEIQRTPIYGVATTKVRSTDMGVVKTVNNANPYEGSNITYTIVVTNNGSLNATGVQYTDLFPTSYVTYVTNTVSQGSYNPTTRVWTVGSVAWSNFATMTITANVRTNTAGETFTNTIYLSAMNQADRVSTNNTSSVPVTVRGVDLGVVKSVNDPTPLEETNVVFTIVLTNNGPNDATGVILTDVLPSPFTYTNHTVSQGTYTGASGIWNVGNLAASNYATLTVSAFVPTNTAGNTYTNRITITSLNEHDRVTTNNTATAEVTPRLTNLRITKSSDAGGSVTPGQTVTYTIVVSNRSETAQGGIAITDPQPTGMTYVSSSTTVTHPQYTTNASRDTFTTPLYSNSDGNSNWASGWLESEGDGPMSGNIRIMSDPVRGATNTLRMQGGTTVVSMARAVNLSNYTNALLSFDYRRESLEAGEGFILEVSTNISLGSWIELARFEGAATDGAYLSTNYDIVGFAATNTGIRFISTNLAMGSGDIVWFDDVTVAYARRQTNTVAGGPVPALATNIYLEPGDAVTVVFQATADSPPLYTQLVNTACATGTYQTRICATVTDKVTYADLAVYKRVNEVKPRQGDGITYTIIITNNGAYSASVVRVTDFLPAGVTYTNYGVSQGSFNSTTEVWDVGTVLVGGYAWLQLQASVNSNTAFQTITNCAFVSNSNQYDPVGTNNTNCVTITPTFETPDVTVTNCAYVDTNGAVFIWHKISDTNQVYDLLYVDAPEFSDSLSNLWALADRRSGTLLIDTGSSTRTPPSRLGSSTLRFYRVSAPGYWEPTNTSRYASEEIHAVGTVYLYPGFNWVRTWGIPCQNRYGDVIGHQLAGTNTSVNSIRSSWCFDYVTQEVWHADQGTTNQWLYSFPTNLAGQSAEDLPLPLDRGWIMTLPENMPTQTLTMIFRVPTSTTASVVYGPTNYGPGRFTLNLLNPNIPVTVHPSQLGLVESGVKQGANPGPANPDQIWRYSAITQKAVDTMWFKVPESNWYYAAGLSPVPSTFRFSWSEAIGYRRYTNDFVWTNRIYYTPPTLRMSP